MPSLFNWNKNSLGMFSMFNRKSMLCATLQGGAFVGILIAASQVLVNRKANLREILTALSLLTLTYGALGERPSIWWSSFLYLYIGTDQRQSTPSTLPKELNGSITVLVFLGLIATWISPPSDDGDETQAEQDDHIPQPH